MTFGSCDHLTERERDVLFCLADGESNRQIARSLDIAPATARTHTRNVLSKLGVQSRVLAIGSARPVHVPALEASYREWLPVVEIDGRRRFTYVVRPDAFRRAVAQAAG